MDGDKNLQCCLGIDIGTTSVKVTAINLKNKSILKEVQMQTHSDIESSVGPSAFEQDVQKIFISVEECLERVSGDLSSHRISAVGVSGQMHGVMLWKSQSKNGEPKISMQNTSPSTLITWRDERCCVDFIKSLPPTQSHLPLATGFGCVSLFWLLKNSPELIRNYLYDCAGTVMDYVVSLLCGLDKPVITNQNAASWGYFNTKDGAWNSALLDDAGFPVYLLPNVVASGSCAGTLQADFHNIPKGTPVLAALGDLQCAVVSSLSGKSQAVLNFSTSSQLCIPIDNFEPPVCPSLSPVQYIPYMEDRQYLAVAASLNGGNVLASFVNTLLDWMRKFGHNIEESKVWEKLIEAASDAPLTELKISPTLFGERHAPDMKAVISNITESDLNFGIIFKSLCYALVKNLREMMSGHELKHSGIQTIKATGSAMAKNPILREAVINVFDEFTVEFGNSCDSAYGAALAALNFVVR